MNLRQQLLTLAHRYCEISDLSVSRVSTIVFNDGKVLKRLAGDRDLTTGRLEHALQWFSNNWPNSKPWPDEISRPAKAVA